MALIRRSSFRGNGFTEAHSERLCKMKLGNKLRLKKEGTLIFHSFSADNEINDVVVALGGE